jgi:HEAT repeat protein
MTDTLPKREDDTGRPGTEDPKSDWRVVLQFFIVPLSLVAVLVSVFFGLQVLRSRRPDVRAALDELKSSRGFLLPWAGDPKRWQSGYDLSLLLRSGEEGSAPVPDMADAFLQAKGTGDVKLRRYLALALGRTGDERAAAALADGLADADPDTRIYCAWGLMQVAGPAALPGLRRAAALDADAGVRKMAVFALGQRGDHEATDTLRGALGDPDRDVRWNASIALARLGDASGETILIGILDTAESGHAGDGAPDRPGDGAAPALNAIRALALLKDRTARDALERAARSEAGEEIRSAARLALETIDAEARGTLP